MLASFALAFTQYSILTPPKFVGLQNFIYAVQSASVLNSWVVTIVYGLLGTLFTLSLALGAGLLLYHSHHLNGMWRTLYYFPTLLSGAAEGLIMSGTWAPNGLVDRVLESVGLPAPPWLASTTWALPAVTLARYWTIGTGILLFLGARANVAPQLYEAISVDGGRRWAQFRYVTLPMISPLLLLNLILGVLGSFQAFSQVWLMTGGGPGSTTLIMSIYIYLVSFGDLRFGYGAAVSWLFFVFLLGLTGLIFVSSRKWVYYEAGDFR
jgi:multiple sugar transport system permease protein